MHAAIVSPSAILFSAVLLADSGAGVHWTMPPSWKAEAQRPMRLATYTVAPGRRMRRVLLRGRPRRERGGEPGPLDRPVSASGWKTVESRGEDRQADHPRLASDYRGCRRALTPEWAAQRRKAGAAMPGYRMLGAIVEGPQGSIFFKFTGPAKTIAANQARILRHSDKMLESLGPVR